MRVTPVIDPENPEKGPEVDPEMGPELGTVYGVIDVSVDGIVGVTAGMGDDEEGAADDCSSEGEGE